MIVQRKKPKLLTGAALIALVFALVAFELYERGAPAPDVLPPDAWDLWWPDARPARPEQSAETYQGPCDVLLLGDAVRPQRLTNALMVALDDAGLAYSLSTGELADPPDAALRSASLVLAALDYPHYLARGEPDVQQNYAASQSSSALLRRWEYNRDLKQLLGRSVERGNGLPEQWLVLLADPPQRVREQRRALRLALRDLRDRLRPTGAQLVLVSLPDRLADDSASRDALWSRWPTQGRDWDFARPEAELRALADLLGIGFYSLAQHGQWDATRFQSGTSRLSKRGLEQGAKLLAQQLRDWMRDQRRDARAARQWPAWLIGRLGAQKLLLGADQSWCAQNLNNPDGSIAALAAQYLDSSHSAELLDALSTALQTADCPARYNVARAVARLFPRRAAAVLINRYQDRCPQVASFSGEVAGLIAFDPHDAQHRFGNYPERLARGESALFEDLLDLPSWGGLRHARWQRAPQDQRQELLVASAVPQWRLQVRAICALAGCAAPQVTKTLCVRATGDLDPRVRRAACWALAWDQSEDALEALQDAAQDSDPRVARAAAWALGRISAPADRAWKLAWLWLDRYDRKFDAPAYGPWVYEPLFNRNSNAE
ncbi:MAG: HEAT repeat domain-containing protein [Candidatus Alcyoniella australis]|nr:HEAT repeat domain-containing protein [Candidatus Alcyoniella australis]